ncbi:replication protein A 14 kDa subunit-like [Argiope bruennichi]|uniref:replication protein A 14 kDa subunit-like n=1 Tax=Argiope bruennichi TaxID=94029 RepID=UPI0024953BC9|nr:replication protein A 14 kDa subunit-like [Argiope bruennichi]
MNEPIYERIANSSLSQHVGKPVTLLGEFDQLEPNGRMFTMKTSPNSTVTIQLQEPVQDMLEGIVEVQGILSNNNTLQCEKINNFPTRLTDKFDLVLYNEVMALAERLPSHFVKKL